MSSPARRRTATVGLLAALFVPLLTPSVQAGAAASERKPRCHGETATIVGTNRADRITGTKGRDVIAALGGNDVVQGLGGDDVICAGGGADKVLGGGGDDYVDAGGGRDVVDGQAGADVIWTGGGKRELAIGGAGNDHLVLEGNGSHALAGVGADYVDVYGRAGDVDGGPGDDVLRGGPGDDTIEGGDGADICTGNGGRDTCDGGAPGGDANTPGDPDRCDAEEMRSCRSADSTAYSGTAGGTLQYSVGVIETWTATFTMDSTDETPQLIEGPAIFQWAISGTDPDGCTYQGASALPGRASFAVWLDFGYYTGQLYPDRSRQVEVTVTCPGRQPQTEWTTPLNGDAANTGNVPLHSDMSWIRGDRSYHPGGDQSVTATWSWDAR
ncbi:calcium-binding protein [Nocardioides daeguensis]|uniref:Calcium-binding protein n=1 Tax=Nocardioides daeguensis TaxID=908359 RepID=A0ABP6VJ04_9ACTN|nr:calcium-binding protein [Nocardioides daeguensis]MBV6728902.1 hypothetical protein [Nocardioides daeguensis]MCR1773423.1 hypothetical protein [Nocardioides daeguensis]